MADELFASRTLLDVESYSAYVTCHDVFGLLVGRAVNQSSWCQQACTAGVLVFSCIALIICCCRDVPEHELYFTPIFMLTYMHMTCLPHLHKSFEMHSRPHKHV